MKFEIAPKETEIVSNWNDAIMYCFSLNIDGKTGWRLPTKDELNQIFISNNDLGRHWYWSSTGDDIKAAIQTFALSKAYQTYSSKQNGVNSVRAIRDL